MRIRPARSKIVRDLITVVLNHVSYSSLTLFSRCPRQWYLRYAQSAIKPAMPITVNTGKLWHEWQERYAAICREAKAGTMFSEGRALAALYGELDPKVEELADKFIETFAITDRLGYPDWGWHRGYGHIEVERRVPLGEGLPDFVCKIDAVWLHPVERRLIIVDFKTPHFYPYDPEQIPMQLRWYCWAVQVMESEFTGEDISRADLWRWVVPQGEGQLWQVEDKMSGVRGEIVRGAKEVLRALGEDDGKGSAFPPAPHLQACQYCPYSYCCKEAQGMAVIAPTTAGEAKCLATYVEALEANLAQLKRGLQAWAKERGTISFGDREWGYFRPQWYDKGQRHAAPADPHQLFKALEQSGKDPLDYVASWDANKLGYEFCLDAEHDPDNPFSDTPEEAAEIATIRKYLTVEEPKPRWGSRKAKPEKAAVNEETEEGEEAPDV